MAVSSFTPPFRYDVFLSFRGQDTRVGFCGFLYKALQDRGISTFLEGVEFKGGDEIKQSLSDAIDESRISIIVFSENYASSTWCLDELVCILESFQENRRLILPVFYKVDPSDYGQALAKHELKFQSERLDKWRNALHQAASLPAALHFKHGDGYEYKFIENIVDVVSNEINPMIPHPVGLNYRASEVNWLMYSTSHDGFNMIGIWGMGGIGKTTLARAVYNSIASQFDASCFLEDVRENSMKHGLLHLQQILLARTSQLKGVHTVDTKGIPLIQRVLQRKKVLLVLDDVDSQDQLSATVGSPHWFGSGTRVIITTRDPHILTTSGVDRTYPMEKLTEAESLELFCWKAFKSDRVYPHYIDQLNRAVTYASGIPLALEVLGSFLYRKTIDQWESLLENIHPNKDDDNIQRILKLSYDSLEEDQKEIFLDIACFFKGYNLAEVEHILSARHGHCWKPHIGVFVEKSLITINQHNNCLKMHDLIQDMCREIVRQESLENPGKRSRLWHTKDIVQVLEEDRGTSEIQIIIMDLPKYEEVVQWDGKAFMKMKRLQTLIIRNECFSEGPTYLPNSLRVLEWWGYPSKTLPSDFYPEKLAILKLPYSCFSLELYKFKKFVNMTILNFNECEFITEIPDLSGLLNLEELSFGYCENLVEIHKSVGFLEKLRIMAVEGCSKLGTFPPLNLTSLVNLKLSNCSSLVAFPEILGNMENITHLSLEHTAIKELPYSIGNLIQLQRLELHDCGMLQLPSSIMLLPELVELIIWKCEGLESTKWDKGVDKASSTVCSKVEHIGFFSCNVSDEFIEIGLSWFANVKELDLSMNNFTTLPACIKECCFLRKLSLDYCVLLREIEWVPPNLETLSATHCVSLTASCRRMLLNQELHEAGNTRFCLPGSKIPEWFEHCSRGQTISFWFRNKFPAISLCVVGLMHKLPVGVRPTVIINGNKIKTEFQTKKGFYFEFPVLTDHILIFGERLIRVKHNVEVFPENEWNHAVVSIEIDSKGNSRELTVVQTGLHILKQKSSMDDIRFTNPYNQSIFKQKHVSEGMSWKQIMHLPNKIASFDLWKPYLKWSSERLPSRPPPALKDNLNLSLSSLRSSGTDGEGFDEQHLPSTIKQSFEGLECVKESKYREL